MSGQEAAKKVRGGQDEAGWLTGQPLMTCSGAVAGAGAMGHCMLTHRRKRRIHRPSAFLCHCQLLVATQLLGQDNAASKAGPMQTLWLVLLALAALAMARMA